MLYLAMSQNSLQGGRAHEEDKVLALPEEPSQPEKLGQHKRIEHLSAINLKEEGGMNGSREELIKNLKTIRDGKIDIQEVLKMYGTRYSNVLEFKDDELCHVNEQLANGEFENNSNPSLKERLNYIRKMELRRFKTSVSDTTAREIESILPERSQKKRNLSEALESLANLAEKKVDGKSIDTRETNEYLKTLNLQKDSIDEKNSARKFVRLIEEIDHLKIARNAKLQKIKKMQDKIEEHRKTHGLTKRTVSKWKEYTRSIVKGSLLVSGVTLATSVVFMSTWPITAVTTLANYSIIKTFPVWGSVLAAVKTKNFINNYSHRFPFFRSDKDNAKLEEDNMIEEIEDEKKKSYRVNVRELVPKKFEAFEGQWSGIKNIYGRAKHWWVGKKGLGDKYKREEELTPDELNEHLLIAEKELEIQRSKCEATYNRLKQDREYYEEEKNQLKNSGQPVPKEIIEAITGLTTLMDLYSASHPNKLKLLKNTRDTVSGKIIDTSEIVKRLSDLPIGIEKFNQALELAKREDQRQIDSQKAILDMPYSASIFEEIHFLEDEDEDQSKDKENSEIELILNFLKKDDPESFKKIKEIGNMDQKNNMNKNRIMMKTPTLYKLLESLNAERPRNTQFRKDIMFQLSGIIKKEVSTTQNLRLRIKNVYEKTKYDGENDNKRITLIKKFLNKNPAVVLNEAMKELNMKSHQFSFNVPLKIEYADERFIGAINRLTKTTDLKLIHNLLEVIFRRFEIREETGEIVLRGSVNQQQTPTPNPSSQPGQAQSLTPQQINQMSKSEVEMAIERIKKEKLKAERLDDSNDFKKDTLDAIEVRLGLLEEGLHGFS